MSTPMLNQQKSEHIPLRLSTVLFRIIGIALSLLTIYELIKHRFLPADSPWKTSIAIVLFSSAIAALSAYPVFRRIKQRYQWTTAHWQQEIAERERVESALRQERDFAESAIATAPAIVVVLDPEGHILRINPYMERISGYTLDEVKGKDWFAAFLPERDRARIQVAFEQTIANIEIGGTINAIRTKNGDEREIEWYSKALQDSDGNTIGVLSIGQDITERVQAEERLLQAHHELEQRVQQRTQELERRAAQLELLSDIAGKIAGLLELENLFNQVALLVQENFGYHHVGVFTLDPAQPGLMMQAKAGQFAHLFPDDHCVQLEQGVVGWVGARGETFLANDVDDEPQYINYYPEVIPTLAELSVPIRIGAEILGVLDTQSPQRNAFDDVDVLVMETLADQIAVAIVNGQLYQKAQQELREREQAEKALREAERLSAMGYITATLAHEIKNPLQAIQSNLELLCDYPLEPDEQQETLGICYNEVQHLIEITQSVLSLARSRKEQYHPIDLHALLRKTFDLLRHPLQKASVEVQMDDPVSALPAVMGDEDQLRQVLLNLTLNAIEAMSNGGVLKVNAHVAAPLLHLDFTNAGPLISDEHLAHLFEPFFTTKPQGAGMGLFISHHILQQHNGSLHATNLAEEQGVVFTVTLPIAAPLDAQETMS